MKIQCLRFLLLCGVFLFTVSALAKQPATMPAGTANPQVVVVGVYFEDDGVFTEQPQELKFEVGVHCYTWTRKSSASHDDYEEGHLHYNASDESTYEDGTFRWTEYGPEHSQADIDTRCGDAVEGEEGKWVNWTEYFKEDHGVGRPYYLKIKGLE